MIVGGLFPLIILVAAGYGLYRLLASRSQNGPGAETEVDLRQQVARLFRLGLLFASLVLAVEGLVGLLAEVLPRPDELTTDNTALAQALSFTIVGIPALLALASWTRRRLTVDPDELASTPWAAYLGGTSTLALVVALVSAHRALAWMVGLEDFDGSALARTVLWGAVLGAHLRLERRRPLLDRFGAPEARTPWYLIVGSMIGLLTAVTGSWELLRSSLRPLYDYAFADVVAQVGHDPVLQGAVSAVLGIGVWVWYWLLGARRGPRTDRWYAYTMLVGVLGGLVGMVASGGVLIHAVLQWFFGDPAANRAAAHFDLIPGTVSAALIAAAIWIHHRRTLDAAPMHRTEVDRVYTYLAAFVGLVTCAIAVVLVVAAFIEATAGTEVTRRSVANPIVVAVTFVLIGLPVWIVFWRRAEANAVAHPAELRSPSRRLYVLALLGLSAAVALVSSVVLLTIFLEDATSGELSSDTVRRLRIPLGLVLSAATVAGYHALVYRDDRRAGPPPPSPVPHVREVFLVSDLTPEDAGRVAHALGGRVVRLTTTATGPTPGADDLCRAVAETEALAANRALVIVRNGSIDVQALRDG